MRLIKITFPFTIVPTDPCDISLCSHSRHQCQVVDGMATCVCNEICPLILMPVCGSDGQAYPNNCSLEVEACVTGKELTVVAMGECGKNELSYLHYSQSQHSQMLPKSKLDIFSNFIL